MRIQGFLGSYEPVLLSISSKHIINFVHITKLYIHIIVLRSQVKYDVTKVYISLSV